VKSGLYKFINFYLFIKYEKQQQLIVEKVSLTKSTSYQTLT